MYKPLLMMRIRGLMGPIPFKAANLKNNIVKSAGNFIGGGDAPVIDPPIASGTFAPPDAKVGAAYSYDISVLFTGGNVSTYTLNGTLPDGLSLHPSTGVISGTPTQEEVATGISITGTNTAGSDTTNTASITVAAAAVVPIECDTIIYGSHLDGDIDNINTSNGVYGDLDGTAELSTVESKFGTGSIFVPRSGNTNYLNIISGAIAETTRTIEFFFNITDPGSSGNSNGVFNGFGNSISIGVRFDTGSGTLEVFRGSLHTVPLGLSANTWHHMAITIGGGNATDVYVNGTLAVSAPALDITGIGGISFGNGIGTFSIGGMGGYQDEILVLDTVKYTGDFTPPTAPFETTCVAPPVVTDINLTIGDFFEVIYGFSSPENFGSVVPQEIDGVIIFEITGTNSGESVLKFGDGTEKLNDAGNLKIEFGVGQDEIVPWSDIESRYDKDSSAFAGFLNSNSGLSVDISITELP